MLGVELTAARLRRAVHLGSAVVADSGRREAAGGRAGARAWAERVSGVTAHCVGLHVVPDERPVGARRTSRRLSEARPGSDVGAEALTRTAAAQLRQDVFY